MISFSKQSSLSVNRALSLYTHTSAWLALSFRSIAERARCRTLATHIVAHTEVHKLAHMDYGGAQMSYPIPPAEPAVPVAAVAEQVHAGCLNIIFACVPCLFSHVFFTHPHQQAKYGTTVTLPRAWFCRCPRRFLSINEATPTQQNCTLVKSIQILQMVRCASETSSPQAHAGRMNTCDLVHMKRAQAH